MTRYFIIALCISISFFCFAGKTFAYNGLCNGIFEKADFANDWYNIGGCAILKQSVIRKIQKICKVGDKCSVYGKQGHCVYKGVETSGACIELLSVKELEKIY